MSIYTVNGSPVKYDNKWLATNGGTPSSELPPYDSSDAGKALVVNSEGDDVEWQAVGSTITVDQTYDSTSTNPQSGTAVADAISTKQDVIFDLDTIRAGAALGETAAQPSDLPSSDELVPSASSGDAGKVLTVDSNGDPQWITPSAGTVYTPGDGIDIASSVISADVDGTTIGIDSTTKKIKSLQVIPTKTSDLQNDSNFVVSSSLATVATTGSYADLSGKPSIPSVDQSYNAASSNAQSGTAVAQAIANIPAPSVDEVPAVTSSDDGKVLKASYSGGQGSYAWGTDIDTTYTAGNMIAIDPNNSNAISVSTTAGITDIQIVNALPASPVATVMYLIPAT